MSNVPPELLDLREKIDAVDERIVRLLGERQRLIDAVIAVKTKEGIAARLPDRVEEVLQHVKDVADATGADRTFVESVWRQLIEWSITQEEERLGRQP